MDLGIGNWRYIPEEGASGATKAEGYHWLRKSYGESYSRQKKTGPVSDDGRRVGD